jgi:hypothetical protein
MILRAMLAVHIDSTDSVPASIASEYGTCQYAYATARASETRQVKSNNPEKEGYPGPPGWRLVVRVTTPCRKKKKKYIYIYMCILLQNLREEAMVHPGL